MSKPRQLLGSSEYSLTKNPLTDGLIDSAAEMQTEDSSTLPDRKLSRHLVASFWSIAVIVGGIKAWEARYAMNPDGIPYLDIADAYLRGDWGKAFNAYWSPFYSWLLGLVLVVLRPSPYWEFPVVQLVNFLIFLSTIACFHLFLHELGQYQRLQANRYVQDQGVPLPDWALWTIGYTIFIWSSVNLITISIVSPDMCVAAVAYLASGIILRIQSGSQGWFLFGLLGAVLGLGYLAKTPMFLLAFVFLGVSLFSVGDLRKAVRLVLVALVVFLSISGPFIFALSKAKGRLTFGDSGTLNYAWAVNATKQSANTRKLMDDPVIYEFTNGGGTYPLWNDPYHWYEQNLRFGILIENQFRTLKTNATKYLDLFLNKQNIFVLGFLIFFLISRRGWNFLRDLSRQRGVLIPALAALTMYSLVLVEWRYVGAFVVLFWLAVASAFRFPRSDEARRLAGCVCIAMVLVIGAQEAYPLAWRVISREAQDHVQWQIADGLSQMGIQPGDKVANIGDSKHAYWARLGRTQIVAEIRGKESEQLYFWAADPLVKSRVISAFASTGAKVIVGNKIPKYFSRDGWQRIGNTDRYAYLLPKS